MGDLQQQLESAEYRETRQAVAIAVDLRAIAEQLVSASRTEEASKASQAVRHLISAQLLSDALILIAEYSHVRGLDADWLVERAMRRKV